MPKPTTPTLTPFAGQLPNVNDPATWAARTPIFWTWVTGDGYQSMADTVDYADAAAEYIDAALDGSQTVVDSVSQLQLGQTRGPVIRFTASGTYTPSAGCVRVEFRAKGGGGAGGGVDGQGSGTAAAGGGGGEGGECFKSLPSPSGSYTVVIGSGGSSVTAANGGGGGQTTVTGSGIALSANGGIGGSNMVGTNGPGLAAGGGTGGGASGGDINMPGSPGITAFVANSRQMSGGYGAGKSAGRAATISGSEGGGPGGDGLSFGSGGGGASVVGFGNNEAGGAGFRGLVEIVEYF